MGITLPGQRVDLVVIHGMQQQAAQPQQRTAAHRRPGDVGVRVALRRHDRRARPGAHHQERCVVLHRKPRQGLPAAPDGGHLVHGDQQAAVDALRQELVLPAGDGQTLQRR